MVASSRERGDVSIPHPPGVRREGPTLINPVTTLLVAVDAIAGRATPARMAPPGTR